MNTMKVKDLKKLLEKCDDEADVYTEGCDCTGSALSIDTRFKGEITINRGLDGDLKVEEKNGE